MPSLLPLWYMTNLINKSQCNKEGRTNFSKVTTVEKITL